MSYAVARCASLFAEGAGEPVVQKGKTAIMAVRPQFPLQLTRLRQVSRGQEFAYPYQHAVARNRLPAVPEAYAQLPGKVVLSADWIVGP